MRPLIEIPVRLAEPIEAEDPVDHRPHPVGGDRANHRLQISPGAHEQTANGNQLGAVDVAWNDEGRPGRALPDQQDDVRIARRRDDRLLDGFGSHGLDDEIDALATRDVPHHHAPLNTPPHARPPRRGDRHEKTNVSLALAQAVRWAGRFLKHLEEHRLAEQATIIAFNIIYAMFPLALTLAAIGGFAYRGGPARTGLLHAIHSAFPAEVARQMADVIETAGTHSGVLGLIGFLALFWAGSNLFAAIE